MTRDSIFRFSGFLFFFLFLGIFFLNVSCFEVHNTALSSYIIRRKKICGLILEKTKIQRNMHQSFCVCIHTGRTPVEKTPTRLDPWENRDLRLAYWFLNINDEIAFLCFLFASFLFNFLCFHFSNFGFLMLLFWLPSGIPPCPPLI